LNPAIPQKLRIPSAGWWLLPIVAVRAAGFVFGAVNLDECDFLVTGRMLIDGAVPYVGFVEKKPPLAYLFYAPAAWSDLRMWPMQLLAIGWVFATCFVVARVAREWTGREDGGLVAGWLACLAQVACMPAVNLETLLNLPAAAALLLYLRAVRSGRLAHALGAGLCLGIATLFKHQAGILLVALTAALALARPRRATGIAALLIGGFAVPWAATAAVFAGLGHLDAFFEWNVARNFYYGAHTAGGAVARCLGGLAIGIALAAPLHWALAVKESAHAIRSRARDAMQVALVLALWLTFLPVSLGGRFYDHYFIQFAPIVSLLATPAALRLLDGWPALSTTRRRLVLGAAALPIVVWLGVVWGSGVVGRFPLQDRGSRELARWLDANTSPQDRLFVWGHFTPIYVLARRLPGTRYYNTSVHIGDFDPGELPDGFDLSPYVSQRDVEQTLRDLEMNRPVYFVDTAPADIHEWHRVPLALVPPLKRYVDEHYALVARPAGALVYRRREGEKL
jgi:hypothetical protein